MEIVKSSKFKLDEQSNTYGLYRTKVVNLLEKK